MITKFKIYESINEGEPKVGDYVICHEKTDNNALMYRKIEKFINSNIGKIVRERDDIFVFWVDFEEIPNDNKFKMFFSSGEVNTPETWRKMKRKEIIYWSKNREDLEPLLASKKFNL